jgi:transcriptional regulator with XRE-family HTH domain
MIEDFGTLLSAQRKAQGKTVRDVAAATKKARGPGVSIALLSLLEKKKRVPTYPIACVLAKVLGIDIETMLAAAYRARMVHYYNREMVGLAATINKRRLGRKVNAVNVAERSFLSNDAAVC